MLNISETFRRVFCLLKNHSALRSIYILFFCEIALRLKLSFIKFEKKVEAKLFIARIKFWPKIHQNTKVAYNIYIAKFAGTY